MSNPIGGIRNPNNEEAGGAPQNIFPVSEIRFRYGGTGSRVPAGTQGMQRNNRDVVSQRPFGKPWASIASSE